MSDKKNILVTGAAGFIGSHLVRRLEHAGHTVHVLARPKSDLWRLHDVLSGIHVAYGDLTDAESLKTLVASIKPDGVFHLAVSTIMSGVTASDEEVIKTNLLGSLNLMRAMHALGYGFFINTGSFLEYGMRSDPAKEDDHCQPLEVYGIAKLAATLYGQAIAQKDGKPIVTFRILTPYGPFIQKGRLVYELISRALRHAAIDLTDPAVPRDFIFVEDIVDLYMEAMTKAGSLKGEVFNLGSGQTTTLAEVCDLILKTTSSRSTINWGAAKSAGYDKNTWQADMAKTHAAFAWRPKHTLKEGIEKTIHWFQQRP